MVQPWKGTGPLSELEEVCQGKRSVEKWSTGKKETNIQRTPKRIPQVWGSWKIALFRLEICAKDLP